MTKDEFAEKWGYPSAQGFGGALFDCRTEILKDLESVIADATPKVSDDELTVMVSNAMQQDEHIAWDKREIKLLGDMIRAKYESKVSEMVSDEEVEKIPYCTDCGSDDLAYIGQYANGIDLKCKQCGKEFIW